MDIRDKAKEISIHKGGIAKSAYFIAAGIRAVDVINLCDAGFLDHVRHGDYALAEKGSVSEKQLLATLIPKEFVCVESALFHYRYYDIYYIANKSDFDGKLLTETLKKPLQTVDITILLNSSNRLWNLMMTRLCRKNGKPLYERLILKPIISVQC